MVLPAWLLACLLAVARGDEPVQRPAASDPGWKSLFDGKSMGNWEVVNNDLEYARHGEVVIRDQCLLLQKGAPATGIRWKAEFPKTDYEISLEAKRTDGGDFFCGLSFPVQDQSLTLILGGWGGWVCGLSCIDGQRAIDNQTMKVIQFKDNQWYRVRVRVTKQKTEVWLDDQSLIAFEPQQQGLTVTEEMAPCLPLGVATWYTTGSLRNLRYRMVQATPD